MARRKKTFLNSLRSMEVLEDRRLLAADLNGDGRVEFADFLILAAAFGENVPGFGAGADIDGDGSVGFADFTILSNNFGARVIEFEAIELMDPSNAEPFEFVVRSTEEWHALLRRTNPGSSLTDAPVAFDEFMLIFASFGEKNLGIWAEVDCVMFGANQVEVDFRFVFGGAAPPPGSYVSSVLIAVPTSDLPVRFMELASIALP